MFPLAIAHGRPRRQSKSEKSLTTPIYEYYTVPAFMDQAQGDSGMCRHEPEGLGRLVLSLIILSELVFPSRGRWDPANFFEACKLRLEWRLSGLETVLLFVGTGDSGLRPQDRALTR